MQSGLAALYERSRGGRIESVHFGAFAVVDSQGNLLAGRGDPRLTTFMRSSIKPIQALPFVEAGGPAHFGLTGAEVALCCASHTGTPAHTAAAASIQTKAGFEEKHLQCGAHPPFNSAAAAALKAAGQPPGPNHNNCSGKHSGMLAFARFKGWPLDDYLSPEHPVQQAILSAVAAMTGTPREEVGLGTDGCSAPNFAVPLRNAALAFARLTDPHDLEPGRAAACRKITAAMTAHPEMVAGPGEFDSRLMSAADGKIVSKGGAEGYQVAGILPGSFKPGSPGIGIAVKISDGDPGGKVRAAVVMEFLAQNGILSEAQLEALAEFGPQRVIRNVAGTEVGHGGPIGSPEEYSLDAAREQAHGTR